MSEPRLSDDEFIALWQRYGGADRMARETGRDKRSIQRRRQQLAERGVRLTTIAEPGHESRVPEEYRDDSWTFPREKQLWIDTGSVVVFSDAHYWPGEPTVAHKALLAVIRQIKPRAIVANGDVFDGGSIGRHPPFGWSRRPGPVDELHACQERMGDIEQAAPNGCELLWNLGNHCIRWERTLATQVEQFAGLEGLRLADHFLAWEFQWSTLINGDGQHPVMVKHKFASSGIHAAYNATLRAGYTTVSGHTHQLEVKAWGDYRGRRWGVQTGSLADLSAAQFEYMENNPTQCCSGFAVLTFMDGVLMPPELCEVIDGRAFFRGEVVA